jgi:N-acetylmuramic acid 6-phosphate etherase
VPELDLARSPTEQRNPASANLHRLSTAQAIEMFLSQDARIPAAVRKERNSIRNALERIVRSFQRGGRLFYVGAGTSGRLGILDASECPPTFRTPPDLVQGIIAGGLPALVRAAEGAEDDPSAGASAIRFRGVRRQDVVLGIAASGRTPFVWGALAEAKRVRATTILLCFNPALKRLRRHRPSVIIAPNLGPELLTGSSRLKAGTATKLVLNILSTLAMVRMGRVISNLMVDLNPSNAKLRDRAVRIVGELTGLDPTQSRSALEACGWDVRRAVQQSNRYK